MPLIIAIALVLLVLALVSSFFVNALRLRRDVNHRLNVFRARLEAQANSVVDDLLKTNRTDDGQGASD
jgi:sensor domain CHASE-containing protein